MAVWFAQRPVLYPEFLRLVLWKVRGGGVHPRAQTGPEAAEWARLRSVSPATALYRLSGATDVPAVRSLFPETFTEADARVRNCPVRMGGGAHLDFLYSLAESVGARRVVETGVAHGWSSLVLLLSVSEREEGVVYSTDMPYPNRENDRYVGAAVPERLYPWWRLQRQADRQGLPKSLKRLGIIDLCHYDSDKSYEGRMWAYKKLWNGLRPGGILMSDDIQDNLAFYDFALSTGREPVIVRGERSYVGILRRPSSQKGRRSY